MARRFRPLTQDRLGELPEMCRTCAFWEGGVLGQGRCGEPADESRLIEWIATVRSDWGDCGRVAYEGGKVLGFVKYAPGRFFPRAASMPSGPPNDDAVLIACLHVVESARHAGLGKVLLKAAFRDLVSRGERVVEAYGSADPLDREHSPLMKVEFLLRQGFTVARPHPIYPLMRLELKSLVPWTENVEAVLDRLQIPVAVPERAPAPLAKSSH
jgi:GNAT superfamily N-acetyltransferase